MMKINWPQAFAEIGLLVIGGALALGGDAWMDHRRDLKSEHAYLVSLRDDFEETRQLTAKYLDQNRRSLAVCLELLGVRSGPPGAVSPERVSLLIKDAFWVYTLEPVRATYLDMVSSGDLETEPLHYPDPGFGPDMNEIRSRDFRNIVVARSIVYQDVIVYGTAALRRFEGIFELLDGELRRFQR